MLKIEQLEVNYGVIAAIKGIDLEVNEGEIVTLIGANGAGKTSILKAISGLEKIKSGNITFNGESLQKMSARNIMKLGISHVPEGRRIFSGLTVLENLEMGAYLRKDKEGIKKDLEAVYERFPILRDRSKQDASTLSGGEQQMLAMGRALMSKPKLLLLD
ncbi:MAG: ABC transporter ATP-binding protein, partial [Erysipelotrichaceae bacterium]